MFLDYYISTLLTEHEFVIIPGFGAFLANPRQSTIDIQGSKIFPPQKKLAFNPSLTTNDGLLVHLLAQKEKVSYTDAIEQINLTVSDWKQKLAERKRVLLVGIGELKLNDDQKIIFNPLEKNNLLPESLGLEELILESINRRKIEITKKQIRQFERKSVKISQPRKILYYSLSGYIPLLLVLWAILIFKEPFKDTSESNLNVLTETVSKTPENAPVIKSEKFTISKTNKVNDQKDKIKAENIVKENSTVVSKESTGEEFYVIGGSFKTYKKAAILQDEFNSKNYQSEIIKADNGQYRVTYAKLKSREEASKFLEKIRQNENATAWLLKK